MPFVRQQQPGKPQQECQIEAKSTMSQQGQAPGAPGCPRFLASARVGCFAVTSDKQWQALVLAFAFLYIHLLIIRCLNLCKDMPKSAQCLMGMFHIIDTTPAP